MKSAGAAILDVLLGCFVANSTPASLLRDRLNSRGLICFYLDAPLLCPPSCTSLLCCCKDSISPLARRPSGINKVNLMSLYFISPWISASLRLSAGTFSICCGCVKIGPRPKREDVSGLVLVAAAAICFNKSEPQTAFLIYIPE